MWSCGVLNLVIARQEMGLKLSNEAAGADMGSILYNFRKAKTGKKAKEEMQVCRSPRRVVPRGPAFGPRVLPWLLYCVPRVHNLVGRRL
jgi:hypothetical protein